MAGNDSQPRQTGFPPCGQRVSVIGTSGSGKTTTGRAIAARLGVPYCELDALHWEANWTEAAPEVMQERVQAAVAGERWVIDGNYSRVRLLIWGRADTIVFLDFPFLIVLWQLMRRTFSRSLRREELWAGNRESLRKAFFSRDSILLWMLQTYRRRKRQYPQLFRRPEYAHLQVIHLKSPRQRDAWLSSLRPLFETL